MNKRLKKKFVRKYNAKSYFQYRTNRLFKIMDLKLTDSQRGKNNILHVIDSKRMDLKHPIKVEILINCVPVATKHPCDNQETEKTIEFKTGEYIPNLSGTTKE